MWLGLVWLGLPNLVVPLWLVWLLWLMLWLVLIRPQRARQQRQRQLLESVEHGDEVLTVGGLYGIVQSIDEVCG